LLLARVLVAQRFGVSLGDVNSLNAVVLSREGVDVFNTYPSYPSVVDVLQLRLIPDLLYAAIPIAIAYVRFR
jgi:hypothetical protein